MSAHLTVLLLLNPVLNFTFVTHMQTPQIRPLTTGTI